jgi:hypothetical protein
LENLKKRDHLEELGIDGSIILKWILKENCGKVWTGFILLRIGSSEYGTELFEFC